MYRDGGGGGGGGVVGGGGVIARQSVRDNYDTPTREGLGGFYNIGSIIVFLFFM